MAKTKGNPGQPGKDGRNGKDGSPDTPEQIIRKINRAPAQFTIPASRISGLPRNPKKGSEISFGGRGGGGSTVRVYDLSGELNGVTKSFTIPENDGVILVTSSSVPFTFRPTVDFAAAGTTLAFSADIDAASMLAAGQSLLVIYK